MRYTPSHEWVCEKDGLVGITEFAAKELGDVVYVQMPELGKILKVGEEACVLESTKAAADVYTPVSGEVIAINEEALSTPSLISLDPEKKGWLFKLRLTKKEEIDALMQRSEYQAMVE